MPFPGKVPHASPHLVVGLGLEPSQVGQLVSPWWWCGSASAPAETAQIVAFSWRPQVAFLVKLEVKDVERCWKMDEHGWKWKTLLENEWTLEMTALCYWKCLIKSVISCQLTMVGDRWLWKNPKPPPPLYSGRRCPWGNSLRPKHPVRRSKDASLSSLDAHSAHVQHNLSIKPSISKCWHMLTNTHFFSHNKGAQPRDLLLVGQV